MTAAAQFRRRRRRDAAEWAGYRSAAFARSTGTLVVVVDGFAAGIESPGMGAPRYFTVCDDHGRLVGHSTLKLARYHASAPEEWCGICSGTESPEDE